MRPKPNSKRRDPRPQSHIGDKKYYWDNTNMDADMAGPLGRAKKQRMRKRGKI